MKKPPTALVVILLVLVAVLGYVRYTPRAQQPPQLVAAVDRIRLLVSGQPAAGEALRFDPPPTLPDAVEGKSYLPGGQPFSFCDPPATTLATPCPPQGSAGRNPSGGAPPYRFQLKTGGGSPPAQLKLETDGRLTGTPAVGTGNQRYEWIVCAVDSQGTSVCGCVALFVSTPASTTTGTTPCASPGGGTATATGTATRTATGTATRTATGTTTSTATGTATGTGTATSTATGTATRTATSTPTPGPGPGGELAGVWSGTDTQTDTACDYAGTVRLTLTQSATTFAGTATYTLNLTRDKIGGSCLPTRNYALAVSGTTNGRALTFNIGGAWQYTGTVEGSTLRAVGTVTAVGITTTDTMSLSRQ